MAKGRKPVGIFAEKDFPRFPYSEFPSKRVDEELSLEK